jgi:DNA-binding NtrC family response regulator
MAPTGTETILLVEDESGVRDVLRTFLVSAGYVVHDAGSGADAERLCREIGHVDLLLSDVVIPDANGPELAARLRELVPGMRTLLISGYPADALSHAGIDGEARYLPKPFTRAVLLRQVRDALKG